MPESYKLVLGLEIHFHLNTETKMFCYCDANIYGSEPNTHTCPVCLGLPGALPIPNSDAIKATQLLGAALGSKLAQDSRFDRKHYFYPDLPKGYQISQYKKPLCEGGSLTIKVNNKEVQIELERIHLEEDTAKSFHSAGSTLIDFNKSGMPLVEIVTKPVIKSAEEAVEFAEKIQHLARYLGISNADMEKGQFRIEPNISLRTQEMEDKNELPNYKVEIKNINSFRFMAKAIESEIKRQTKVLEEGGTLVQENRGFNESTGTTVAQRAKEDAHDYRYFPDPDIPPMHFEKHYFDELFKQLPELPWQMKERFIKDYKLDDQKASTIVYKMGANVIKTFETLVNRGIDAVKSANMLINNTEYQVKTADELIAIFNEQDSKLENRDELLEVIRRVVSANEKAVVDFKQGKESSIQFLLGMVMRETKGKADPAISTELLKQELQR